MNVNYELYKVFYQVAGQQSFSKAAERLAITQSAVSQAIRNLETQLGVQLFFRKTRQITLTPEGRLLLAHIEGAFNYIRVAESKLLETRNLETGAVHIGVSDTVCRYFLLPHLEKFSRRYPRVKLRVVNRTSSQILEILRHGAIDFGVVTSPLPDNRFQVVGFKSVRDIFVASSKFSQLKHKKVPLSELAKHPLLMLEKSSATRRHLDQFLERAGIPLVPEIELESVDLLVQFAKIGLGIAHVLKESAREDIRRRTLFEVQTQEHVPPRRLGIVTLSHVPLSQAARKMIELLPKDPSPEK